MDWTNFPPLYTLQTVETTRHHQLKVWVDLVHTWAAETKKWEVRLSDCPVFENKEINRKLPEEGRRAVGIALVSDGRAEMESDGIVRLYSKRPTELATNFYDWVCESAMLDGVYTVFELHDEKAADEGNPCRGVDAFLFRKVLAVLEDEGKIQVFKGSTSQDDGVKFFSRR